MRCGLVALAVDAPLRASVLATLPAAAANTRAPDSTALARSRGRTSERRCDDAIKGVQQTQPRNDNRRADGMGRFPLLFGMSI